MAKTQQPLTPATEANGELDAGAVLVRAFNEMRDELISTLLFVLGNRDDAQDVAQDAFVKCWASREQVPDIANLRAWIFRVSFNAAKDLQRSAWKRRMTPLRGEQFMAATTELSPGQSLEFKESVQRLRQAIHGLREDEKEVFLLRQNGDLTYEQIATMRRVPVGTIKTQMRSALDNLRKLLS